MLRPTKSSTAIPCSAAYRQPATRTRCAHRGSRCAKPVRPRKRCSYRQPQSGEVRHAPTGRSIKYGELARDAARVPIPENVALKRPEDFKLIGTPAKRLDTPTKVNGTAVYGIDA